MKRFTALFFTMCLLYVTATAHPASIGLVTASEPESTEVQNDELVALPAIAGVVVGVAAIGAFAYGVYEGWRERQNEAGEQETIKGSIAYMEFSNHNPYEFSAFDN